jgi:hypothetical protein
MPNSYGLTSLTFGTPVITGYVLQSFGVSTKPGVIAEVINESGNRVHARYDDVTNEMSFNAIFNGATLPSVGGLVTGDAVAYEVLSIDLKRDNKGFKTVDIKGKNSQYLTLP